jgi:hypothetical protein
MTKSKASFGRLAKYNFHHKSFGKTDFILAEADFGKLKSKF